MKTEQHFRRIVSELLELVSRYDLQEIRNASEYVARSFQGSEQKRLGAILAELANLASDRMNSGTQLSIDDVSVPNGDRHEPPDVREIRAILLDEEFLQSKAHLIKILRRHLKEKLPVNLERKAARPRLVSWAVSAYARASVEEKKSLYQSLRQAYLRKRESNLSDWAEIISRQK